MDRCHIALGGNVGDVRATFRVALEWLDRNALRIVEVSRLYETPPMGAEAGGTFLNAAATFETALEPPLVLERLLAAEEAAGRVRARRWGPRSIDLDLILYGDRMIETQRLRLPHPGCWYRRFVLDPLAEIAPDVVHPATGETIACLRGRLLPRPLAVAIEGRGADELFEALRREFPIAAPQQEPPSLAIRIGASEASATGRFIGVPDGTPGFDAARALLTAALGVPKPAGTLA